MLVPFSASHSVGSFRAARFARLRNVLPPYMRQSPRRVAGPKPPGARFFGASPGAATSIVPAPVLAAPGAGASPERPQPMKTTTAAPIAPVSPAASQREREGVDFMCAILGGDFRIFVPRLHVGR